MPGQISGPGWQIIGPWANEMLEPFRRIAAGEEILLPNFGMETLHHVHAADVAGVFYAAIRAGKTAYGEGFHAVSPRAVTLTGYAKEAASWYGKEADLRYEPFDEWKKRFAPEQAEQAASHMLHCPSGSMEKAQRLLHFAPRYTSYRAIRECLASFDLL